MASKATNQRLTRAVTLSIGFLVIAAITLFDVFFPATIQNLELKASDLRIYSRQLPKPTGAVVIAAVDDKSIAELGQFPWPRVAEARLVRSLKDYRAAVVAFDLVFSERDSADVEREAIAARLRAEGVSGSAVREVVGSSDDLAFARALREQGTSYLGYFFSSHSDAARKQRTDLAAYRTTFLEPPPAAYNIVNKGPGAAEAPVVASAYLPPIAVLNSVARGAGYVDIDEDADGTARSYMTVIRLNHRYCAPLFLAAISAYAHDAPLMLDLDRDGVAAIAVGRETIPVNQKGQMMVHFRGPPGTIPHYSAADIIAHRVPPEALAGKIVVVGVTAHALGDRVVTPVGGDFPGVEVQATAIDNVLRGDFIYQSLETIAEAKWASWVLGVAISIVAAFMTALSSAVVLVAFAAGYMAYATLRLNDQGTLVGIVLPFTTLGLTYLAIISYRYIVEGREKRYIREAFELYVNPDHVAALIKDSSQLKLGGERRHLAILFCDIMNFTTRAERSEPEPLVALLNSYMTVMTNAIFDSGGVVDKLMGDGIMAFWGAPIAVPNPARDAVDCALRMFAELKTLKATDDRFHDLHIGIGIATGEVIVGNFGGERKFDYSVIGDTVNLASRLEGLTRQFKVDLLVNRQTHEEAGAGYIAREIGLVKVKGKDQLVPVVEVAGREGDGVDPAFYKRFGDALEMLHRGYSPENDLRTLLLERPGDQVTAMCLERLKSADGHPVREMVFEFDTK